jgi:hypothetical protein
MLCRRDSPTYNAPWQLRPCFVPWTTRYELLCRAFLIRFGVILDQGNVNAELAVNKGRQTNDRNAMLSTGDFDDPK